MGKPGGKPGAGAKSGGKKGGKNAGVGVDFKRVKSKVGKTLRRAQNDTDVSFKSRSINLPGQSVAQDKGTAVNFQNLTLKELLNSSSHYSEKTRSHALSGLCDLFTRHPEELTQHTHEFFTKIADRITDSEGDVRKALRLLLKGALPLAGLGVLRPFMPLLMAHVCGAMTHLNLGIRLDALKLLQMLMEAAAPLVVSGYLGPCLDHYCDILSPGHRGRSIKAQSMGSLLKALTSLQSFLTLAFPNVEVSNRDRHKRGEPNRSSTTPAKTDPSSSAAAPSLPAPLSSSSKPSSTSTTTANARQLSLFGSRCAWPAGTSVSAVAASGLASAAGGGSSSMAAVAASAAAARSKVVAGPLTTPSRNPRDSKGVPTAPFQSTTLLQTQLHGSGHGSGISVSSVSDSTLPGGGGGAAVSGSGGEAGSGVGNMSGPEAAVRPAALQLLLLLFNGCWLEACPGLQQAVPEEACVQVLCLLATCANLLLQGVLLTGSATASTRPHPADLALLSQLQAPLLRRVTASFPATAPAVQLASSANVHDALSHFNLEVARLLGHFLPLGCAAVAAAEAASQSLAELSYQQQQQQQLGGGSHGRQSGGGGGGGHGARGRYSTGSSGASTAAAVAAAAAQQQQQRGIQRQLQTQIQEASLHSTWLHSVVCFYCGVLEGGVLVPSASNAQGGAVSGAAAAAVAGEAGAGIAAVPQTAIHATLRGVAAAVQLMDSATASRLMSAVSAFGARQSARSATRLACMRVEHAALRAALHGTRPLPHEQLSSWLAPLPKLLWQLAETGPNTSELALLMMFDAARFSPPGSPLASAVAALQPQLAPLFCVHLPPAKPPGSKKRRASAPPLGAHHDPHPSKAAPAPSLTPGPGHKTRGGMDPSPAPAVGTVDGGAGANAGSRAGQHAVLSEEVEGSQCGACGGAAAVRQEQAQPAAAQVLHPGPLTKLPQGHTNLAIDLLSQLESLTRPLLRALLPVCCSQLYDSSAALRALDVVMGRAGSSDPAPIAAWLHTIMFASDAPTTTADSTAVAVGWQRQKALVDGVMRSLGGFCDAHSLLHMLQPQLQPMADQLTGAATTSLLQRYSFVRLCTLAATQHRARQHRAPTPPSSSSSPPPSPPSSPPPRSREQHIAAAAGDPPAPISQPQSAPDHTTTATKATLSRGAQPAPGTLPPPPPPPPPQAAAAAFAAADEEESPPSSPTGIPSELQALLPRAGVSLAVAMLCRHSSQEDTDSSRTAISLWCDLLCADPELILLPAMQQLVTHLRQHTSTTTAAAATAITTTNASADNGSPPAEVSSCHSVECAAASMAAVMRLAQAALRAAPLRLHVRRLRSQLRPLVAALTDTASIPGSLASHAACATERHKLRQIALDVLQA
ncbi:MAG: hypothetical protein WDW38_003427 [Sanguina aurantia]